jgi:death on curing protein
MEVFFLLNGYEIWASVDEAEEMILRVASGEMGREQFTDWIEAHLHPLK